MSTLFVSYSAEKSSDWLGLRMFSRLPSVSGDGMQFESHLGHSVFAGESVFRFSSVDKA
jgi:hypothetical protein